MIDYYTFGMFVPTRNYSSPSYRYGFQGQEKDDEIKGNGNSVNYKFRMHDPRVGRFFAVDPLTPKYPYYTPYSFSGNRVIDAIELEGLEEVIINHSPEQSKKIENAINNKNHTEANRILNYTLSNGFVDDIGLESDFIPNLLFENDISISGCSTSDRFNYKERAKGIIITGTRYVRDNDTEIIGLEQYEIYSNINKLDYSIIFLLESNSTFQAERLGYDLIYTNTFKSRLSYGMASYAYNSKGQYDLDNGASQGLSLGRYYAKKDLKNGSPRYTSLNQSYFKPELYYENIDIDVTPRDPKTGRVSTKKPTTNEEE